jgi:hypothetical protein
VEDDAPDHLDVEVAEADLAPGGLPYQREGLDQERVEVLLPGLLAERVGACAQSGIVELFELRLQPGDVPCDG